MLCVPGQRNGGRTQHRLQYLSAFGTDRRFALDSRLVPMLTARHGYGPICGKLPARGQCGSGRAVRGRARAGHRNYDVEPAFEGICGASPCSPALSSAAAAAPLR